MMHRRTFLASMFAAATSIYATSVKKVLITTSIGSGCGEPSISWEHALDTRHPCWDIGEYRISTIGQGQDFFDTASWESATEVDNTLCIGELRDDGGHSGTFVPVTTDATLYRKL